MLEHNKFLKLLFYKQNFNIKAQQTQEFCDRECRVSATVERKERPFTGWDKETMPVTFVGLPNCIFFIDRGSLQK